MQDHNDNNRTGRPTSPDAFTSSQRLSPREAGDAPLSYQGRPGANSRSYLETFAAIIRDRRVSHGAFRLWHALRDYTDHTSRCFPGQRRLANDIGCKTHSLKAWTDELAAAGWLSVSRAKTGEGFVYTVLDGEACPLRQSSRTTVAPNGNSSVAQKGNGGVAPNGNGGVALSGNRGVALSGNRGVALSGNRGVALSGDRGVAQMGDGALPKWATKVRSPINQVHLSKWVNAPNTPNNFIPD